MVPLLRLAPVDDLGTYRLLLWVTDHNLWIITPM